VTPFYATGLSPLWHHRRISATGSEPRGSAGSNSGSGSAGVLSGISIGIGLNARPDQSRCERIMSNFCLEGDFDLVFVRGSSAKGLKRSAVEEELDF